jgi:hypothetical protein
MLSLILNVIVLNVVVLNVFLSNVLPPMHLILYKKCSYASTRYFCSETTGKNNSADQGTRVSVAIEGRQVVQDKTSLILNFFFTDITVTIIYNLHKYR